MPASKLKTLSARLKAHTLTAHLYTTIYTSFHSFLHLHTFYIQEYPNQAFSSQVSSHPPLIFTVADVFFAVHWNNIFALELY